MKIWAIAANTIRGFLHDKVLVVLCVIFACIVLLMMTPLLSFKAITTKANAEQMQGFILTLVGEIMSLVSGAGSLLAAWAAASAVGTEMKSGTIEAVMARPLKRWEFLAGKYLGVLLLMASYVLLMLGLTYLLGWMGGERIQAAPVVLVVYPITRYAIYAAIAMFFVTFVHPVLAFGAVFVIAVLAELVAPGRLAARGFLGWIITPLYAVLPCTGLLSEGRFISLTRASLMRTTWSDHLTSLTYGLDYALVCLLLAMWSFHFRSLRRD
jgi:ABC-type transport system involved in multi-copper enzyme maturation permease subunit